MNGRKFRWLFSPAGEAGASKGLVLQPTRKRRRGNISDRKKSQVNFDQIITYLSSHGAYYIYAAVFLGALAENLFPPLPGDFIILAGAYLAGRGEVDYAPLYALSVAGGLIGAMIVFYFGRLKGRDYFINGGNKLVNPVNLRKIEGLFFRWGSLILLSSRFIAGLRSLIALAAGLGDVSPVRMVWLTLASFCIWNLLLIGLLWAVKSNWLKLVELIKTYNIMLITISLAVMLLLLIVYRIRGVFKK